MLTAIAGELRRDLRRRARRQEPADGADVRHPLQGRARAHRDHGGDGARARRVGARRRGARGDDPDAADHARSPAWRSSPSAIWTLRGDRLTEEDERRAARPARHVVLTVGFVFFLAELGDKTMLATITLATREGLFGTWLGSTIGMVVADALAIGVGRLLGHAPAGAHDPHRRRGVVLRVRRRAALRGRGRLTRRPAVTTAGRGARRRPARTARRPRPPARRRRR